VGRPPGERPLVDEQGLGHLIATRITGLRAIFGSCRIMETWLPRSARISTSPTGLSTFKFSRASTNFSRSTLPAFSSALTMN
jgi:hypothetical protein